MQHLQTFESIECIIIVFPIPDVQSDSRARVSGYSFNPWSTSPKSSWTTSRCQSPRRRCLRTWSRWPSTSLIRKRSAGCTEPHHLLQPEQLGTELKQNFFSTPSLIYLGLDFTLVDQYGHFLWWKAFKLRLCLESCNCLNWQSYQASTFILPFWCFFVLF